MAVALVVDMALPMEVPVLVSVAAEAMDSAWSVAVVVLVDMATAVA